VSSVGAEVRGRRDLARGAVRRHGRMSRALASRRDGRRDGFRRARDARGRASAAVRCRGARAPAFAPRAREPRRTTGEKWGAPHYAPRLP
jgi:hypothetical protein